MEFSSTEATALCIAQAQEALAANRHGEVLQLCSNVLAGTASADERATALFLSARAHFGRSDAASMTRVAEEALPLLEGLGRNEDVFEMARLLGYAYCQLEQYANALVQSDRAVRIAMELGDGRRLLLARSVVAVCWTAMGNPWQGERVLCAAADMPEAAERSREAAVLMGNLGVARVQIYRLLREASDDPAADDVLKRAEEAHRRCWELSREVDDSRLRALSERNLAEVVLYAGRLDEAEEHLAACAAMGPGDPPAALEVLRVSALLQRARGFHAEAVRLGEEFLEKASGHSARRYMHAMLHQAYRVLAQPKAALAHSEAAHRLDMQRMTLQLKAQSDYLVSRMEVEEARKRAEGAESDAKVQRELASVMESAAHRDPLTGLANRRMLDKALAASLAQAMQVRHPVSVILADLDHFKRINDSFGHGVGDKVLAQVAAILRSSTRETDCVARLGGEEFVVVAQADERSAMELGERIRRAVQQHAWNEIGPTLAVTISMGVVTTVPTALSPEMNKALLDAADQALYAAKKSGRNRVVQGLR
jgi:diguanylate cyclase (GGDEF)-like protein